MKKGDKMRVSSGTDWENIVGYSRAIRVGNMIEIAGTTAINEDNIIVGINDAYAQTVYIIKKAEAAMLELGSSLEDVIRTRIYTKDISLWEEIGRAHGEYFADIKPVATMVEVSELIDKDILVEIEFSAICAD